MPVLRSRQAQTSHTQTLINSPVWGMKSCFMSLIQGNSKFFLYIFPFLTTLYFSSEYDLQLKPDSAFIGKNKYILKHKNTNVYYRTNDFDTTIWWPFSFVLFCLFGRFGSLGNLLTYRLATILHYWVISK